MGLKIPSLTGGMNIFKSSPNDGQVQKSRGSRRIPSDDDDTETPLKKSDEIVVDAAGNGDFTTIAAALTELGASAGTIRILAGNYLTTTNISLGTNQNIIGSGYGTRIHTTSDITILTLTGNRSSIYLSRIDGNTTGSSQKGISVVGDECQIKDCWITQMGDLGVSVTGDRCFIEGCTVEDCTDDCVYINGSDFMVSDCIIDNSQSDGIALGGTGDSGSIVGNKINGHGENGIVTNSSNQITIVGNYIFSNGDNNNDGDGIHLGSGSHDCCITGNIIHTNDGYGIDIGAVNNTVIMGNSILNNEDGSVNDAGTTTHPNGTVGTNSLSMDDLNVV